MEICFFVKSTNELITIPFVGIVKYTKDHLIVYHYMASTNNTWFSDEWWVYDMAAARSVQSLMLVVSHSRARVSIKRTRHPSSQLHTSSAYTKTQHSLSVMSSVTQRPFEGKIFLFIFQPTKHSFNFIVCGTLSFARVKY